MYTDSADNPLEKPGCKEKEGMGVGDAPKQYWL